MRPRLPRFVTLAVILFTIPTFAAAKADAGEASGYPRKVDRALRDSLSQSQQSQRVIVRVKPGSHDAILKALRAHGDRISADHRELDALSAEIHADDVAALAASDDVLSVSIDARVHGHAAPGNGNNMHDPAYDALRDTLGISSTSYSGAGIVVALIDSGIQSSSDFSGRIKAFYDFTKGTGPIATTAYDDYGHGTHVAGLIGGMGNLSYWYEYKGVAPGVKFVGLKVLDANGNGYTSQVIQAINFAVTNKSALGIDIINLSLGHPIYESASTDPLVQAVERATAAGIVVVTSAGNFGQKLAGGNQVGYAGITSPGNAPSAITVGAEKTSDTAIRRDDVVADYSSRGPTWYDGRPKPDLVAPGDRLASDSSINSTIYNKYPSLQVSGNNNYIKLSGTSMAAGVTSGVVALVMEANRAFNGRTTKRLSPNAVKAILEFSAISLHDAKGATYDVLTQGAGGLNAEGAINIASTIDLSKRVGDFWMTGTPSGTFGDTIIGGEHYAWGQNIIWGSNIIWGDGLVMVSQAAWIDNIVWGSAADNIVWGSRVLGASVDDNIVWGSVAEWADNIVWGSTVIGMELGIDNIVWGSNNDNIVWGSLDEDNIVWGSLADDNIVWGSSLDDNVVWGSIF